MFWDSLHCSGSPFSVECPSPPGPRNCGQSSATSGAASSAVVTRNLLRKLTERILSRSKESDHLEASRKVAPPQPRRGRPRHQKKPRSVLNWSGRGGAGQEILGQHHPGCVEQGRFALLLDCAAAPPRLRRVDFAAPSRAFRVWTVRRGNTGESTNDTRPVTKMRYHRNKVTHGRTSTGQQVW